MTLLLLVLVGSTLAGPTDPIATGEDLVAWRALQEETDPVAWRRFLLEYPNSPLAEMAWRRLAEVGHAPDASANPGLSRIATSYEQHEADLARTPEGIAVATLRLAPVVEEPEPVELRMVRRWGLGLPTLSAPASTTTLAWSAIVETPTEVEVQTPQP